VAPPFRRALLERFPYAVYFLVEGDGVDVLAVLDQRRGPGVRQQRLGVQEPAAA